MLDNDLLKELTKQMDDVQTLLDKICEGECKVVLAVMNSVNGDKSFIFSKLEPDESHKVLYEAMGGVELILEALLPHTGSLQ